MPGLADARRLLSLALPVVGLNVLNVMTLTVDAVLCGHLPDADVALTALGYAGQIGFLLMVAMMGLTVGAVALIARAHGAGDRERVAHLVRQSTQVTVVLGGVVGLVGVLAAGPMLDGLGATPAVRAAGTRFLVPLMFGNVGSFLTILLGAAHRAVGNTRLPFAVALGTNVVNVSLNVVLVFGVGPFHGLGIFGAGVGTSIAQTASAIVLVLALERGIDPALHVPLRRVPIDGALIRELVRVGLPAALDLAILSSALLLIVGMLGSVDATAVAAHGIGIRVQSLAIVPGMSISQATAALVGQALGAADVAGARRVLHAALALCTLVMSALGTLLVVVSGPLVAAFGADPATALFGLSTEWMRMLGYAMPLVGMHLAYAGLLQGAGRTRASLFINVVSTVLVMLPLSAGLGLGLGLGASGVWLGFPLSYVVKAALGAYAYVRVPWSTTGVRTSS